jgi:hypothetical protein
MPEGVGIVSKLCELPCLKRLRTLVRRTQVACCMFAGDCMLMRYAEPIFNSEDL